MMKSLGLCIGASNIGFVILEQDQDTIKVIESKTIAHEGNPRKVVGTLLTSNVLKSVDRMAVTGRKLRHMLNVSTVSEPEAVEYAYQFNKENHGDVSIVVSAGGETFMVYQLDYNGKIIDVYTGNKCASGTGEFFLQQLKRMDVSVEEAVSSADLENPYKVAGRCSVFCKSDCTHALNKGAPKESVIAGLCDMMAGKIMEIIKRVEYKKVLIIGGTAENSVMIDFLQRKIGDVSISPYAKAFEAVGAALWALQNEVKPLPDPASLFSHQESSFSFLPPLKDFESKVIFKEMARQKPKKGDQCIIGLDVGSTTTKAVLMRSKDRAILASVYLRTNGDPIGASKRCYEELQKQLGVEIQINGLGVTGSGRQIAGLHALTPAVINEIIAHAAAAVYFDPEVDTIFEIGGQDAKYTYITNGVASDYAMNEACSAGTGSFLEESAKESLDIDTLQIGTIALQSTNPPNFSDQCAAFISSDIKSAIQEGIEIRDIAAGLVYSIGMNYINRVKGNRAVGNKVFMQGGVCYNKAVPLAMASLTGKEIIVPPDPGLMGAFGVALEVRNKLKLGLIPSMQFDLKELAEREVAYKQSFVCVGGKEKCDRKCNINRIVIKGKTYPFGGACNKYYNMMRDQSEIDVASLDLVHLREKLLFETYGLQYKKPTTNPVGKKVGIINSLLVNSLFPLYYNYFAALGYEVIYTDEINTQAIDRKGSSFCYPIEIAHGALGSLCEKDPDIYFLPHVKSMPVKNGADASVTCPFVQAEPYYLTTAFPEIKQKILLTPVLEMGKGYAEAKDVFIQIGLDLGHDRNRIEEAFNHAVQAQIGFGEACQAEGQKFLAELEADPSKIAVVLFGRPYNAFTKQANMGIPHKFASRGIAIIPHDFLPYGEEESISSMYWAMGQTIMKASKTVKRHPQLFGTYITNFSCGPDSFVVGYFRNEMGQKPSLTLELDGHTADAGLDTRIEAFLDVVTSYIQITKGQILPSAIAFRPAVTVTENGNTWIEDSKGVRYTLQDKKIHLLIPSMGDMGSKLLAATFRYTGVYATAAPAPTEKELKLGRAFASCKECLPLLLTIGSLTDYLDTRTTTDELLVYFMPETSGPCRFGQYNILMKNVIEKQRLEDIALFSLTSENSYAGLGTQFVLRAWHSIIISDTLEEIRSAILVLAEDQEKAMAIYEEVCQKIIYAVEHDSWVQLKKTLKACVQELNDIKRIGTIEEAVKVALIGEIYVRRDDFSRQYLIEKMAKKNIIVRTAPIAEWIYYCDYIVKHKLVVKSSWKSQFKVIIQGFFKNKYEKTIKEIFSKSGFYETHLIDVDRIIDNVSDLISPKLTGETILTVGSAITEVIEEVSGVLSIGPFGCMPARIAEAIISESMNQKKLHIARDQKLVQKVMEHYPSLPFLSIETDGNTFPQVIEARLETFCLQVERLHHHIQTVKKQEII